ncbi:hypothetical protein [Noviherbaspirillum sp.]|uniref:hypothetical protein n=1 Tax=Noviherbaspirillum sp. TaxID=1926288 RepID=UPI002FE3848E
MTKRIRLAMWGSFLLLHLLAVAYPSDAIAPAVAGSIYVPLAALNHFGMSVFVESESGGWPAPSVFGWGIVAATWAMLWWGVASFIGYVAGRRTGHG